MAGTGGSFVLIGREDSTYAGTYNTITGLIGASVRINDSVIDQTSKESGGWRELLDDGEPPRSVAIQGRGILNDDTQFDAIVANQMAAAGTARVQALCLTILGVGTFTGNFKITTSEMGGDAGQGATKALTAESTGPVIFASGLDTFKAVEASLYLDFVNQLYRSAGVDVTALASLAGVSIARASKGWNDNWGSQNGTAVGTLTEFASGIARETDYGLLLEDAVTNRIKNPRCEGTDVTWSYLPDAWEAYNIGSYTLTKSDQALSEGWPSVNIRNVIASPSNGDFAEILFEDRTSTGDGVSSLDGLTYTAAVCVEIAGGSLANVGSVKLRIREFNAGGTSVGASEIDITSLLSGSIKKRFCVSHLCAAGGVYIGCGIAVTADGGGAIDLTLRLGAPQMELAVGASSPVLNATGVPAQTTRAADIITITDSAWGVDEPYTIFAQFMPRVYTGLDYLFSYSNGSPDDYISSYMDSANVNVFSAEAGVIALNVAAGARNTIGEINQLAFRSAASDFAGCVKTPGAAVVTNASWPLPTDPATTLHLGTTPSSGSHLKGYLRKFAFYPASKTEDTLQQMAKL